MKANTLNPDQGKLQTLELMFYCLLLLTLFTIPLLLEQFIFLAIGAILLFSSKYRWTHKISFCVQFFAGCLIVGLSLVRIFELLL